MRSTRDETEKNNGSEQDDDMEGQDKQTAYAAEEPDVGRRRMAGTSHPPEIEGTNPLIEHSARIRRTV